MKVSRRGEKFRFGAQVRAVLIAGCAIGCLLGCSEPIVPKPQGYPRSEYPAFEYARYTHPCGIAFDVPVYGKIERIEQPGSLSDACWFNCALPRFSAKIHCTYMTLLGADHLMELANDAHRMVFSHELKASGIETRAFDFPDHSVSGLLFRLSGPVASPVQFFATDSTDHFLRGSLYFDHSPNPDSLQPSLDHVEQDIVHLIETLAWPETDSSR